MGSKLNDLVAAARSLPLQLDAQSVVISVLRDLTSEEITLFETAKRFDACATQQIAARTGLQVEAVTDVCEQYLVCDLQEYCATYDAKEALYRELGHDDASIQQSLRRLGGPSSCLCVLWDLIHVWDPITCRASNMRIEDREHSDVCFGYLIARGLAFDSCVKMLVASMSQRWPKWQMLWRYY